MILSTAHGCGRFSGSGYNGKPYVYEEAREYINFETGKNFNEEMNEGGKEVYEECCREECYPTEITSSECNIPPS